MSLFLQGMQQASRDGRRMTTMGIGSNNDAVEEEESWSNAVDGSGLPAYLTTAGASVGDMPGPLGTIIPGEGPLRYFFAAALGIAVGQIPAALLIPKIGFWKGYALGAALSGAALTALYLFNRQRTSESSSQTQTTPAGVKGVG